MESENKSNLFKIEGVEKHNKNDDCWIIIEGNVCNVTQFLGDHPGGSDILLMYAGKDCTNEFKDIGHSYDAQDLVKKYKIGKLCL